MSPLPDFTVFFSLPVLEQLSPLPDGLRDEVWRVSRSIADLAGSTPISTPSYGDAPYLFRLEVLGRPAFFEVRRIARLLMVTNLSLDPALAAGRTG